MTIPIRILIIDQHDAVRKQLTTRLEREPGIEVLAGIHQLDVALLDDQQISPNLILLDPLGFSEGIQEILRGLTTRFPKVAVVILTSVVDTFAEIEYRKLGVAKWLMKGIDSNKLVAELQRIVAD
jgi:DNA-binding NarL/FixJ family response regulator